MLVSFRSMDVAWFRDLRHNALSRPDFYPIVSYIEIDPGEMFSVGKVCSSKQKLSPFASLQTEFLNRAFVLINTGSDNFEVG